MEANFDKHVQERAVLVGLNADVFTKQQTATDETLDELEALLETAGGFCTGKILQNRHTFYYYTTEQAGATTDFRRNFVEKTEKPHHGSVVRFL